jgi:hypothetical protein
MEMSVRRVRLAPVDSEVPWVGGGLLLQAVAVGTSTVYVLEKAKHEDLGATITRATIRLAWHQALHAHTGLLVLIASAVGFGLGSVLMARPFVRNPVALLVAVPLAGVAGLVIFGAAALVIVLVVLLVQGLQGDIGGIDMPDLSGLWPGGWVTRSGRRDDDDDSRGR